ncbi:MAG TPA: adenylate/guanylate cyclase domain-containing protein [Reyranella sp.]|nr:adenylate/guanylate cyclase domain-containing protein [Reyranella sp.]
MTTPATPTEIAAIRRRYLLMATSVVVIDIASALVFFVLYDAWSFAPRSLGGGLVLLLGANYVISSRLFAPIERYLKGATSFEDTQRRITQLPLLTARSVAILILILTLLRLGSTYFFTDPTLTGVPRPTIAQVITLCIVLPVFFFTYTYFVISAYLAELCTFIFRHYGRSLELFFGSYNAKLIVALTVISIAPMAAIIVALFSYEGDRLRIEITNVVGVALMGVAITAYFITRSLLRPIRILSDAMGKVAEGDLSQRVPVTSNDEVGELTGQFNNMVEGLRERERFRETFGRYVDESVAATILKREGEGVLAGETREATILFTDIAGFTTIAEHLAPDALVAALNEYLETVLEPIRAHGGVVNTFIGDGLFASFNMPLACENHACAAVRAAIDIQRAVGGRTFGDMGAAFATRIGISTGQVIGGSVGAGRRLTFTLLGDTVNLAARLEQLNKDYGTRILVSNSTREACGDQFVFADLGSVAVRGRSDAAIVFSVDPHGQG